MARKRPSARRSARIDRQQITEALTVTLDREFADYVATRVMPAVDDRRGRERYTASLRRMALSSPKVGVQTHALQDDPDLQTTFGDPGDLTSLAKTKFSAGALSPIRLGQGLYDFYPPELPPKGIWNRQPFTFPFSHNVGSPVNSTLLLAVPQVGSGKFYASASTFSSAVDRHAHAWCGTALPIDPNLHDAARGPKDVVVWAEGSISYDYALSATPGSAWNARPEAANATVYVMARLLRFSRQTGTLLADPDAKLAHLAYTQILKATMLPNTATDPKLGASSGTPVLGGGHASYSSLPLSFSINLENNQTRKLETDSTYQVAVICAVGLSALASGQAVANAQVSALLSLRLATLGILEHDPKVVF